MKKIMEKKILIIKFKLLLNKKSIKIFILIYG